MSISSSQVLQALQSSINLSFRDKKLIWYELNKEILLCKDIANRFSEVILGNYQTLIAEVLNFISFNASEGQSTITTNFKIVYDAIVFKIVNLPENQTENYLLALNSLLHSRRYSVLFSDTMGKVYSQVQQGKQGPYTQILQYYLKDEIRQSKIKRVCTSPYHLINCWNNFQQQILIPFHQEIETCHNPIDRFSLMLKIFTIYFKNNINSQLDDAKKSSLVSYYLKFLMMPNQQLYHQSSNKIVLFSIISQFLIVGIESNLVQHIQTNLSLIELMLFVSNEIGSDCRPLGEFWNLFIKKITPESPADTHLKALQEILCTQIIQAEQSENLDQICNSLNTIQTFIECYRRKSHLIHLQNFFSQYLEMNPQNEQTLSKLALKALFILTKENPKIQVNKQISQRINLFLDHLNKVIKIKVPCENQLNLRKLASELLGLKMILLEKPWILVQKLKNNHPCFFTLLKYLFFLIQIPEIQHQAFRIFDTLIKQSLKDGNIHKEAEFRDKMSKVSLDCFRIFKKSQYLLNRQSCHIGLRALDTMITYADKQTYTNYIQMLCSLPPNAYQPNVLEIRKSICNLMKSKFQVNFQDPCLAIGYIYQLVIMKNYIYYQECFLDAVETFKDNQIIRQTISSNFNEISKAIARSDNDIKHQLRFLQICLLQSAINGDGTSTILDNLMKQINKFQISEEEIGRAIKILKHEARQNINEQSSNNKLHLLDCTFRIIRHLCSNENQRNTDKILFFLNETIQAIFITVDSINLEIDFKYSQEGIHLLSSLYKELLRLQKLQSSFEALSKILGNIFNITWRYSLIKLEIMISRKKQLLDQYAKISPVPFHILKWILSIKNLKEEQLEYRLISITFLKVYQDNYQQEKALTLEID